MLTEAEKKELEQLERELGNPPASSGLTPEEAEELKQLEAEFGEAAPRPATTPDEKMQKVQDQLSGMREDSPEMFDEQGQPKPVELGNESTPMEKAKAFGTGAVKAGSLGFADEIYGAGKGAYRALTEEGTSLGDAYKEERDAYRQAEEEALLKDPMSATLGETAGLAGSMVAGGAAAGLGKTALQRTGIAATEGALEAAGTSQADLTEGEYGEFAADTAIGGAIGGAVGGASEGLSKVIKKPGILKKEAKLQKTRGGIREGFKKEWSPEKADIQKYVEPEFAGERARLAEGGSKREMTDISRKMKDLGQEQKLLDADLRASKAELGEAEKTLKTKLTEASLRRQQDIAEKLDGKMKEYIQLKQQKDANVLDKKKQAVATKSLKESTLLKDIKSLYQKMKSTTDSTIKENMEKATEIYNKAYQDLKPLPPKELPSDIPGLRTRDIPDKKIISSWEAAKNATNAAEQAKALKEVRKGLYGLTPDKRSFLIQTQGQDPFGALNYINDMHGSYPGLGKGDKFYKQAKNVEEFVKEVGTRVKGDKKITEESAKKIAGFSPSKLDEFSQAYPQTKPVLEEARGVQGRQRDLGEQYKAARGAITEEQARNIPAPDRAKLAEEVPFREGDTTPDMDAIRAAQGRQVDLEQRGAELGQTEAGLKQDLGEAERLRGIEEEVGGAVHSSTLTDPTKNVVDHTLDSAELGLMSQGHFAAKGAVRKLRNFFSSDINAFVRGKPLEALRVLGNVEKELNNIKQALPPKERAIILEAFENKKAAVRNAVRNVERSTRDGE